MANIGILGPKNTFHDLARKKFLPDFTPEYFNSFEEIFNALKNETILKALIAIENSNSGDVGKNKQIIEAHGFRVIKKYDLPVHLCLGSLSAKHIEDISQVFSHPMAIKETINYFSSYNHMVFKTTESTAAAIEKLKMSRDSNAAVISSREALQSQGFYVVASDIHDHADNTTTFALIVP